MNKSIITVRNAPARRNALSTIAFHAWEEGNRLSTQVFNAWEAANLTFTRVILTFTLYLKLPTRYDRLFQASHAPFTAIAKIFVSNFTKQRI